MKKNKKHIGILFIEDTLSGDLVTEALLQRNSLGIVFRNAALIRSTRGLTALKDDDEIVFRIFGTNCVGNPPGTKALPHNICLLFFSRFVSIWLASDVVDSPSELCWALNKFGGVTKTKTYENEDLRPKTRS